MVFNLEDRTLIVDLYDSKNPNAAKVARRFNGKTGRTTTYQTVGRIWKENGLQRGSHGGRRTGMNDNEVREIFEQYAGDYDLAEKSLGYAFKNILSRWKKLKLS